MLALSLQQKRITRNSDPCTSLAECLDDYLQMNTKTTSTQASKPNDSRAHLLGLFQRWAEMKERNLSALHTLIKCSFSKLPYLPSHEKNNPFFRLYTWLEMEQDDNTSFLRKRSKMGGGGGGGGGGGSTITGITK